MKDNKIIDLLVSVVVLMSLFSGVKLVINRLPDDGIVGDLKKFWMIA